MIAKSIISYLGSYNLSMTNTNTQTFTVTPEHDFGIFRYVRGSYDHFGIFMPKNGGITQIPNIDSSVWAAIKDYNTKVGIATISKVTSGTIYLFSF